MYKPLPQILTGNEGEEEEDSELYSSSFLDTEHYKYPSAEEMNDAGSSDHAEQCAQSQGGYATFSLARKMLLILSIVNCLAFIVIFLWVLPCEYDTCQSPFAPIDVEWEIQLDGKNTQFLQIISSQYSKYQDVLLIVSKTDLTNGTCLANSSTTNLLAVRVVNGKPNWERNVTSMHYLNCSLIDANRDGVDDCLIFSTGRGLSALDAQSGVLIWELHNHEGLLDQISKMSLVNLNSVFDVNNDSTVDLVAVLTASPSSSSSILVAICGRSGKLMWQMTLNSSCSQTELVALIDQLNFNSPCLPNKSPVNLLANPSQLNNVVMDLSNFKPAEPFSAENIKYQQREARSLDPLYLAYQGLKNSSISATVNCSASFTLLKKIHV